MDILDTCLFEVTLDFVVPLTHLRSKIDEQVMLKKWEASLPSECKAFQIQAGILPVGMHSIWVQDPDLSRSQHSLQCYTSSIQTQGPELSGQSPRNAPV